jgi:hypothetical protein
MVRRMISKQLTTRNRLLLEKIIFARKAKKFSNFRGTQKFVHYHILEGPPLHPMLSQLNSFDALKPYFFITNFNINSPSYLFPLVFRQKYIMLFPFTIRIPHASTFLIRLETILVIGISGWNVRTSRPGRSTVSTWSTLSSYATPAILSTRPRYRDGSA